MGNKSTHRLYNIYVPNHLFLWVSTTIFPRFPFACEEVALRMIFQFLWHTDLGPKGMNDCPPAPHLRIVRCRHDEDAPLGMVGCFGKCSVIKYLISFFCLRKNQTKSRIKGLFRPKENRRDETRREAQEGATSYRLASPQEKIL